MYTPNGICVSGWRLVPESPIVLTAESQSVARVVGKNFSCLPLAERPPNGKREWLYAGKPIIFYIHDGWQNATAFNESAPRCVGRISWIGNICWVIGR